MHYFKESCVFLVTSRPIKESIKYHISVALHWATFVTSVCDAIFTV